MSNEKWTLDEWIAFGHVGTSSKTMWTALKGIDTTKGDIPCDPDDFSRCYKLVKKCNIDNVELVIISERIPFFKPIIDNWDRLCELYESKNWNLMCNLMHKLRDESQEIRAKQ